MHVLCEDTMKAYALTTGWFATLFLFPLAGSAQPLNLEPRVEIGSCTSDAPVMARSGPGQSWQAVSQKGKVYSRDLLLSLPGSTASLQPGHGAIRLTLQGNTPAMSPYPVLEAAVVLHDTRAYDLDFTLDRGRIILTNIRDKGSARVWARLPKTAWDLTLNEPDARVAVELYGRWPRGVPFNSNPQAVREPTRVVVLNVLKGSVTLKAGNQEHLLKAPPGPAYFHWDSLFGRAPGPRRVDALPEWAQPGFDSRAEVKQARSVIQSLQKRLKEEKAERAIENLLSSADRLSDTKEAAAQREIAVYALGAIDDLSGLFAALTQEKHPQVRDIAVQALRHWIGQSKAQDYQLYRWIAARPSYNASQAETILQLLHSPFDSERAETYQTLIAFLQHQKLAIRELARWHLYRLVPAGRKIDYDAAGSQKEREAAWQKWKELIPAGKLPPREEKRGG